MEQQKFLYRDMALWKPSIAVLLMIISTLLIYPVAHSGKGLFINGIIHLSPEQTINFYGYIIVVMTAIILYAIFNLFKAITREKIQRYVVLNEREISLPKNASSNEIITITYPDIKNINFQMIQKKCVAISIKYSGGYVGIHKSSTSENDFNKICDILSNMTKPKL